MAQSGRVWLLQLPAEPRKPLCSIELQTASLWLSLLSEHNTQTPPDRLAGVFCGTIV